MSAIHLRSARFIAKDAMLRHVRPGDTVADATMGNGHDTLLLARLVGPSGQVHAFDVQAQAVEATQARLLAAGMLSRVTLHHMGHEHMAQAIRQPLSLCVFNLGWLPGSDKQIRTQTATTLTAIHSALSLLAPMGLCILCIYPGHPEGDEERTAIHAMLAALRPQSYNVLWHAFVNAGPNAPECVLVQKQGE